MGLRDQKERSKLGCITYQLGGHVYEGLLPQYVLGEHGTVMLVNKPQPLVRLTPKKPSRKRLKKTGHAI